MNPIELIWGKLENEGLEMNFSKPSKYVSISVVFALKSLDSEQKYINFSFFKQTLVLATAFLAIF